VGTHTITAKYSGDGNFAPSSTDDSAAPQVIIQDATTATVTSASNPSVFGQVVTFTAQIAPKTPGAGTPTGLVDFKESTTDLTPGGVGLTSGQATFTTASETVGSHTITATYAGDVNFLGSTGDDSAALQIVKPDSTTTTVISAPNASVFGQAATFTAAVNALAPGAGTPTGTVDFMEGSTDLTPGGIALSGGTAIFSTAALTVGSHTISASYAGDTSFLGSNGNDSANPQTVNQASTSTILSSSPSSSVFGQPVIFTAVVSVLPSGAGIPAGSISFQDGTVVLSTVSLSSGQATFSTASLSTGGHSLTAVYGGSSSFSSSTSAPLAQNVSPDPTTTVIKTSVNPSVFGQALTFTATVSSAAPGAGIPTGTVLFMDGGAALGNGSVNGQGQATFSTSSLAVSGHSIVGAYGGDGNFAASSSIIYGQAVNRAGTTTTVNSSLPTSVFGQFVTFTASVSALAPGAGTPGGIVAFQDGTTVLATSTLNGSGQAIFRIAILGVGTHTITAAYSGNAGFLASQSAAFTQTVGPDATSTSVASSVNPSTFGQTVTFTAAIAALLPGAGTPTGTVTFQDLGAAIGTANLSAGQATFTTSTLAVGNHSITGVYGGDGNFAGSTSIIYGQAVNSMPRTASVPATAAGLDTIVVAADVPVLAMNLVGAITADAAWLSNPRALPIASYSGAGLDNQILDTFFSYHARSTLTSSFRLRWRPASDEDWFSVM
jgi:hypothetical protein